MELMEDVKETVRQHLFETGEELSKVLEEKYGIPKTNITYEYVNGVNELTIKFPDTIKELPIRITILGEEVVNG